MKKIIFLLIFFCIFSITVNSTVFIQPQEQFFNASAYWNLNQDQLIQNKNIVFDIVNFTIRGASRVLVGDIIQFVNNESSNYTSVDGVTRTYISGRFNENNFFNNGGNVGIGTDNLTYKFEVYGGNANAGSIKMGNWADGATYNALFMTGMGGVGNYTLLQTKVGVDAHTLYINRPQGGNLRLRMNNNDQVVLLSSGNLGVATSTPNFKLEVVGNISLNNQIFSMNNGRVGIGTSTPVTKFEVNGSSTFFGDMNLGNINNANLTITISGGAPGNTGALVFNGNGGRNIAKIESVVGSSFIGDLRFYTNPSGSAGAETEKMRILGNGNVGVGTTTPSQKLNVNGSIALGAPFEGDRAIYVYSAGGAGNVTGQIYTAPYGFYVQSTKWMALIAPDGFEMRSNGIFYWQNGTGITKATLNGQNGNFATNGLITISGNGNNAINGSLGVGTFSPLVKMQIKVGADMNLGIQQATSDAGTNVVGVKLNSFNDAGNAAAYMQFGANNFTWKIVQTEKMRLTTDGKLGIGTNNPASLLEVNGTIRGNFTSVDGTLGITGTCTIAIGTNITYKNGLVVGCS